MTARRSYSTSSQAVESRPLGLTSGKTHSYLDNSSTKKYNDRAYRSSSLNPTGKKTTSVRSGSMGKDPARKSPSSSKSKEPVWSGSGKDIIGHREPASGSRTTVCVTEERRKGGNPSRYSPTGGEGEESRRHVGVGSGGEESHRHVGIGSWGEESRRHVGIGSGGEESRRHVGVGSGGEVSRRVAVNKVQHGTGNSNRAMHDRDKYTSRYDTHSRNTTSNIGTNTNNSNSNKPARESCWADDHRVHRSGIPGGGCTQSKTKDSHVSPYNGGPVYAMNPLSTPPVNGVVPSVS